MVGYNRKISRKKLNTILLYVLATAGLMVSVFPYFYLFIQSFSPWSEVDRSLIPSKLNLQSYKFLFQGAGANKPWLRAFMNSVLVTGACLGISLISGLLVGYALSRLEFKGKKIVSEFLLFQMFYPGIILLVPLFLLIVRVGFFNTYLGMILPKAVNLWAIFLYSNFFLSVPKELIEAARLDGASEFKIIFRIMLPLSLPITTVIGLLLFMRRWGELLWDMIVVQDYKMMTLNVLLAMMSRGEYQDFPGAMYAATVILTAPLVVLFVIFGKRLTTGIHLTLK